MRRILNKLFILLLTLSMTSCFVSKKIPEVERNLDEIKEKAILTNGFQTVTTDDGATYTGNFVDGLYEGEGILTLADGTIFVGTFKRGNIVFGTAEYGNQNRYTGYFKNNKWNGKGYLRKNNGSYYKGNFESGKITGKGQYYKASTKTTVTGNFKNGTPTGEIFETKTGGITKFKYLDDYGNNKTTSYINNKAKEIVDKNNYSRLKTISEQTSTNIKSTIEQNRKLKEAKNIKTNFGRVEWNLFISLHDKTDYNEIDDKRNINNSPRYRANGILKSQPKIYLFSGTEQQRRDLERKYTSKREIIDKGMNDFYNKARNIDYILTNAGRESNRLNAEYEQLRNRKTALIKNQQKEKPRDIQKQETILENSLKKMAQQYNDRERDFEAQCLKDNSVCGCEKYVKTPPCPKNKGCACAM